MFGSLGFPELIAPELRWHLSCFAQAADDGLVFTGPAGALLRRGNFRRRVWLTVKATDLEVYPRAGG